jgi:SAM-dependent methyltransferase
MTRSPGGRYVFDTAADAERRRLEAQTELWDPFTFQVLAATGVTTGWRCLEIGAGTGSVAAWLVDRVGPDGLVVATDVETRWLEPLASPNLVVRHHNVVANQLDERGYHLIHARLVLEHLAERQVVVAKLAAALRPGGWLVVDDYDLRTVPASEPPHGPWRRVGEATIEVLRAAGADPYYGSKLLHALRTAGLADATAEALVRPVFAPALAPMVLPVIEQMREALLATGRVTAGDIDDVSGALLQDGDRQLSTYTPILVSARGRRHPSG